MKKLILALLLLNSVAWADRPFKVEDMQKLKRIGEAVLSPDGKWIAYTQAVSNVAKNKNVTNLWMISSNGGSPSQLTYSEKGSNSRPRWSPDSKYLYFLSTRAADTPQIFRIATAGGEAAQITHIDIGVDSFLLSPDGKRIAVTATVYPECKDFTCNDKKKKEVEENPVKARTITSIPFRRWDTWIDGKRNHIFVMPSEGGVAKDVTPGDVDSPIWSEAGGEEVAFSPDGKEICFSRYTDNESLTANSDLYIVPVNGGNAKRITNNKALDTTPLYSADGRYIAYQATLRPNAVTDLTRLFMYDRNSGESKNLTESLDRSISSHEWSEDSKSIWITFQDKAQITIAKLELATGSVSKMLSNGSSANVQSSDDGTFLIYTNTNFARPMEIFRIALKDPSKPTQLTNVNQEILKDIAFGEFSSFDFRGAKEETVQCWQVKPPNFRPDKNYPLLLLMHGGPESAWDNLFHYRWNAQLFAAAGYVVILPNFHGSSGFGLEFMDSIKGDWGGAPYQDQMKAVDVAMTWPYVDRTRLAAAGASYGGYMANWVAGHTDRFRALVSHDGLYDLFTSLYSADFIGGLDKEFGGTPWESSQALIDQAPVTFAKNFKTPMLIIHGEKDYRVDPSNALAMFQVLQAMHIPSKLLYFSEENHWILKPADSILWYHTVLDWLEEWVKPDQAAYQKMLKRS
jgi:dipeptidyl aminopeptidase/acylaminoacyl peptidase